MSEHGNGNVVRRGHPVATTLGTIFAILTAAGAITAMGISAAQLSSHQTATLQTAHLILDFLAPAIVCALWCVAFFSVAKDWGSAGLWLLLAAFASVPIIWTLGWPALH